MTTYTKEQLERFHNSRSGYVGRVQRLAGELLGKNCCGFTVDELNCMKNNTKKPVSSSLAKLILAERASRNIPVEPAPTPIVPTPEAPQQVEEGFSTKYLTIIYNLSGSSSYIDHRWTDISIFDSKLAGELLGIEDCTSNSQFLSNYASQCNSDLTKKLIKEVLTYRENQKMKSSTPPIDSSFISTIELEQLWNKNNDPIKTALSHSMIGELLGKHESSVSLNLIIDAPKYYSPIEYTLAKMLSAHRKEHKKKQEKQEKLEKAFSSTSVTDDKPHWADTTTYRSDTMICGTLTIDLATGRPVSEYSESLTDKMRTDARPSQKTQQVVDEGLVLTLPSEKDTADKETPMWKTTEETPMTTQATNTPPANVPTIRRPELKVGTKILYNNPYSKNVVRTIKKRAGKYILPSGFKQGWVDVDSNDIRDILPEEPKQRGLIKRAGIGSIKLVGTGLLKLSKLFIIIGAVYMALQYQLISKGIALLGM